VFRVIACAGGAALILVLAEQDLADINDKNGTLVVITAVDRSVTRW
jgi:hypothetical protein